MKTIAGISPRVVPPFHPSIPTENDPRHTFLAAAPSRREALALYLDILRTTTFLPGANEKGEPWSVAVRRSAREEFEMSRQVLDPSIHARMVVQGRAALEEAIEKLVAKHKAIVEAGRSVKGWGRS